MKKKGKGLAGEIFYLLKICILRLILWIIYQIRVSSNPQKGVFNYDFYGIIKSIKVMTYGIMTFHDF